MHFVVVKMVRGEDHGEDRDVGLELHLHEPADHRFRHELVPVNAAVYHQRGADDRGLLAGFSKATYVKRQLEGARDTNYVNVFRRQPVIIESGEKGSLPAVKNLIVP